MERVQQTELGFSLSRLLKGIIPLPEVLSENISGLSTDSRQVNRGDLFIACAGRQADGRHYIDNAIDRGAVAVLAEADEGAIAVSYGSALRHSAVPIIKVPTLDHYLGSIAARFYGDPSQSMRVVGFTGTNGKTSCTQFMAQALASLNKTCGIVGTLGSGFLSNLEMTGLTTPNAVVLQRQLASLQDRGAEALAMEVSSHGLSQGRTQGVVFNTAVLTNLTQDHLDYHGSMKDYALAKRQLFLQPGLKYAVFNMDDPFGRELAEEFRDKLTVYGYSIEGAVTHIPLLSAENIRLTMEGFQADVVTPWGKGQLSSALLGRFNVTNLLAILAVLSIMEIPLEKALASLGTVRTIAGRMETFGGGKQPLVVIDYAHTPDALEKALLTLREYCTRKLWCVFGCGGNRDSSKRKLMGQIAEQHSDQLVITDDNPRFEDPEHIARDIVAGLLCPWAAEIEHDRGAAIAHVIQSAVPGDVVLIAGKGHENYQLIGHDKLPFNDAEQVGLHLSLRRGVATK